MGKGATDLCSSQRKHGPDTKGWSDHANLPAGDIEQGSRIVVLRVEGVKVVVKKVKEAVTG